MDGEVASESLYYTKGKEAKETFAVSQRGVFSLNGPTLVSMALETTDRPPPQKPRVGTFPSTESLTAKLFLGDHLARLQGGIRARLARILD